MPFYCCFFLSNFVDSLKDQKIHLIISPSLAAYDFDGLYDYRNNPKFSDR